MQARQQSIVILISGEGSNMLAIAQALRRESWPARISAVISNKAQAPGLAKAKGLGLPCELLEAIAGEVREAYDQRLLKRVLAFEPDWVVLAGFMRILSAEFVHALKNRLINIHPSLLPAFPGLNTHARALAAGVKTHGATVHWVIPALDAGPIIAQSQLDVVPDESAVELAARVQALEHALYPQALARLIFERQHEKQ
jgi:phosphoribosylglycinamide formyltransferase 1